MIVKDIQSNDPDGQWLTKTKSAQALDRMAYINGESELDPGEKVLFTETVNFRATNFEDCKREMAELAEKSGKKCKNPIQHIVISLHAGEHPTRAQAREAVEILLKRLGYDKCQYAYSIHVNTDNDHIHIVVNRTDPETKKVHWVHRDHEIMHQALAVIEDRQGWQREENGRYLVVDGEVTPVKNVESFLQVKIPEGAKMLEKKTGEASVTRIAADEGVIKILLEGKTWAEVHENLAPLGFTYRPKGGGAVLSCRIDGKEVHIKPSDLHKKASLKYMTDRLGAYIPFDGMVTDRLPIPLPGVPVEAFNAFQEAKGAAETPASIIRDYKEERKRLETERKAILKAVEDGDWTGKGPVLAAFQKTASRFHKDNMEGLAAKYKDKLDKGRQVHSRISDFEIWTALNRPQDAEKVKQALANVPVRAHFDMPDIPLSYKAKAQYDAFYAMDRALEADRYRLGSRGAIDGKKVMLYLPPGASKEVKDVGFTPDEVHKWLPMMLELEEKSEHEYHVPFSERLEYIPVDDLATENIAKAKRMGFKFAYVQYTSENETSEGEIIENFQAYIKFPKISHDKQRNIDIANAATEGFNRLFGDINFSGTVHPTRLPEFHNPKSDYEEYRKKHGEYPLVKTIEASGAICEKMLAFAIAENEYLDAIACENRAYKAAQAERDKTEYRGQPVANSDYAKIYIAHRDAALRLSGRTLENSGHQLADMVAIRLRGAGHHDQAEVEAIIRAGAPIGRVAGADHGRHDWDDFAKRTAAHAFSEQVTYRLNDWKDLRPWLRQWRELERQALETPVDRAMKEQARQARQEAAQVRAAHAQQQQQRQPKPGREPGQDAKRPGHYPKPV